MTLKQIKSFETFLMKCGALVLPTTNEWELIRFRCDKGVGIIYQNKSGAETFCGPAEEAWNAFIQNQVWSCINTKRRIKRIIVMDELLRRDGYECFFCGRKLENEGHPENAPTLEHLLAIASGGNNHISNLALAHQYCNSRAADMSLIDKIKLRESLRAEIANEGIVFQELRGGPSTLKANEGGAA